MYRGEFSGQCKRNRKRTCAVHQFLFLCMGDIPQQIEGIKKSLGDDVTIDYKFMDTKNVDTAEMYIYFTRA